MSIEHLISMLKEQVKPALGCTEPAAIAIAVARAKQEVSGELRQVSVVTSGNIFKNANGVGIPGTNEAGIPFAVALALACGDASKGLEVFASVSEGAIIKAKKIMAEVPIFVDVDDSQGRFFIKAQVTTQNNTAECIIRHTHTNIELVRKNEQIILNQALEIADQAPKPAPIFKDMTIKALRESIETIALEDIAFLIAGVPMNFRMAELGLSEHPGLGLGSALHKLMEQGILNYNIINKIRMYAAAAADARMAGLNLPVMSSAGSGNHGITAILPPYLLYRELHLSEEKLIRALAFSHLVTIAIKEFSGPLSPVCGCAIAAGVGAAVSMAWLLDCNDEQIAGVINSMSGTLAGMLCDGAKGGCAFKLSTAAGEAALNAYLAKENVFIAQGQGIVAVTPETTIQNIGLISTQGMQAVDSTVIGMMLAAKNKTTG